MEYQHMSNGDCVNHEHLPNSLLIDVINENSAGKEVYLERFDLEEYIKVYSGYAELHRLLFIANRCPSLRAQALLLALQKVKLTSNYHLYSVIHGKLTELSKKRSFLGETAITVPPFDADWFEVQKRKAKAKFEKLDQELNVYRCNSIKESIRRGFLYLGEHHLEMGELGKAYKCASKAIQHCCDKTTMLSAQLTFIKLCIYTQRWSEVISVSEAAIATIESEVKKILTFLNNLRERKLMEENLIVREILQTYIDCQYKKLFSLLDSIRFLYPYSSVSMQTMASTFDTSVEEIERQLILLIEAGYITDRVIDSVDKYIYMRKPDPRHVLAQKADIQLRKLRRLVEKSEEPLMDRRRNHCE
ncbi:putative COP9 signalosome complex subunit 1 [Trichinella spiralis]|uniref:putative COP9 signalosome complex subunit 1 n=1 Tax=Trichinella spiralis TaxID=6334 RepID=UPI0001EFBF68|nr:putative COP9 signalosome complex subunit 1 [Trichinella spiralis]